MRVLWVVPAKLKLLRERVTMSRLTIFYFAFSVLHAILQVGLQTYAFSVNAQAASFLWDIIDQGNATTNGVVVYNGDLRLCMNVPSALNVSSCEVIWDSSIMDNKQAVGGDAPLAASSPPPVPSSSPISMSLTPSSIELPSSPTSTLVPSISPPRTTVTLTVSPSVPNTSVTGTLPPPSFPSNPPSNKGQYEGEGYIELNRRESLMIRASQQTKIRLDGLGLTDQDVFLNRSCLVALNQPASELNNAKREDVVFIAFQIWVLGMSVVAILNESIPHVLASLLMHMLLTGWSGFQISSTAQFHNNFRRLATEGGCNPANLLATYWNLRRDAEIALLVSNTLALIVAGFLSWRLTKVFGWKTFKRIGASVAINRQYTVVLILSIAIQISLFFILAAVSLWIDQLFNGTIARLCEHNLAYKILVILAIVLLVPWLSTGWFSVRRESRIPMLFFLGLSCLYLLGWGAMFASDVFRWTVVHWSFFGTMVGASIALTAATLVCGVVCRLGFGKGLPRYLNSQEVLPGNNFAAIDTPDVQKVDFPSGNRLIPTYSASFGSGDEVPPPSQMQFGPRRMGFRYYNGTSNHFEPQLPAIAHTRSPSSMSQFSRTSLLLRSDSTDSSASYSKVQ